MFLEQYDEIIESLKKTDSAIIALGCSFVQGQGAVDADIISNYTWKPDIYGTMRIDCSEDTKCQISKLKSIPINPAGDLDFTQMEYRNAFPSKLVEKYLSNKWTAINLGVRGNGNRSAIKQLYYYPEFDLSSVSNKIVIYCPSGIERFDLAMSTPQDHFNFVTMWPHYDNIKNDKFRKMLWEGYAKTVWSEYHEVMEQLYLGAELKLWCDHHNAKLIIFPGFDDRYTREYFEKTIAAASAQILAKIQTKCSKLIDLFPWENVITIDDSATMIDVIQRKATGHANRATWNYWDFYGKGSEDGLITSCSHPSAIAHEYFADRLYLKMLEMKLI